MNCIPNKPPQEIPRQDLITQTENPKSSLSFFHETVRDVWFYVSMALVIVNITYTLRPQLVVQATTSPRNPLASLFTLTNPGFWSLKNVNMQCVVWERNIRLATFTGNTLVAAPGDPAQGNPTIPQMARGATATRDCGIGGQFINLGAMRIDTVRIDIMISYDWGWGLFSGGSSQRYDMRPANGYYVLVPDVEN